MSAMTAWSPYWLLMRENVRVELNVLPTSGPQESENVRIQHTARAQRTREPWEVENYRGWIILETARPPGLG